MNIKLILQMAAFISIFLYGIIGFALGLRETAEIIDARNICVVAEYEKENPANVDSIYDYCDAKATIDIKEK